MKQACSRQYPLPSHLWDGHERIPLNPSAGKCFSEYNPFFGHLPAAGWEW
jgi:hypothetical protein